MTFVIADKMALKAQMKSNFLFDGIISQFHWLHLDVSPVWEKFQGRETGYTTTQFE